MPLPHRISLSTHGAVELAVGLALVIAAFALATDGAGLVAMLLGGAALAGVGLSAADLPLAAHRSLDRLLIGGLAALAVLAASAGSAPAAIALLTAAALQLALESGTRWTRSLRV